MSGLPEQPGSLDQADTFDQEWSAALAGELPPPGSGQSRAESVAPAPPASSPPAPVAQAQPAAAPLPDHIVRAAREAGFDSVEEALKAARNFTSMKGQLPNLEEKWRKQHVEPLTQKLSAYEQREKEAWEQFVRVDPLTGYPRPQNEQAELRAKQEAENRAEQDRQAQAQALQQFEADRATLAEERQQVGVIQQNALKLVALNSLTPYRASLAKEYKVPEREIQQYMDTVGFVDRVQALEDLHGFGPLLEGLENHVKVRAAQLEAERQQVTKGKYRDVGTPSGAGGQRSGDRWDRASDQEFDQAWERAKRGELV